MVKPYTIKVSGKRVRNPEGGSSLTLPPKAMLFEYLTKECGFTWEMGWWVHESDERFRLRLIYLHDDETHRVHCKYGSFYSYDDLLFKESASLEEFIDQFLLSIRNFYGCCKGS